MDAKKKQNVTVQQKKALFAATVDSHILNFHLPYLKMLQEMGYETHVATNGHDNIPYCDHHHAIYTERSPFKINNLKAIKQIQRLMEREHFDLVHCHTPMGAVVARLAAKKIRKQHKTRVIYTAHGFHFYKGAPLINWLLFYPVEKYLAKYTDTLVTINKEDYARAKKKFSKRCHDIQYVPGVGLDTSKFDFKMTAKEKLQLRESLGIRKDDFVIIYPARIDKNKNHGALIEIAAKLVPKYPDIHFIFPGRDEQNWKCQQKVESMGLGANFHFLGFRSDVPKLFKISNLAVSSSKREGLPLNLLEAINCNLPIVAFDCRGVRDIIKDKVNGYLVPMSDNAKFERCIIKIYESQGKCLNQSVKNKIVMKNCSLTAVEKLMCDIYSNGEDIDIGHKKRVLHLLSSNRYSGAEKVVCRIIQFFKKEPEYEMIYCSPDGPIKKKIEQKGIQFIPLAKLNRKELRRVFVENHIDIVHAHDFRASCLAALAAGKNVAVISHLHNNAPWIRKINMRTVLFLLCSRKMKRILLVSDSVKKEFIFAKLIPAQKFVTISNPVSVSEVLSRVNKTSDPHKKYDICCVGRLTDAKNPSRFVRIIAALRSRFPNLKVIWVGDGRLRKPTEKIINSLGLNDCIKILGYKNNQYDYMNSSKIFMMTSKWEGFGLAVFEAMALGLPCVVSNVGGIPKLVDKQCGELCKTDDDFCKEIANLLDNPAIFKKKSSAAKSKAEQLDNYKTYKRALGDIYAQA